VVVDLNKYFHEPIVFAVLVYCIHDQGLAFSSLSLGMFVCLRMNEQIVFAAGLLYLSFPIFYIRC
jgi:hypothetical protein